MATDPMNLLVVSHVVHYRYAGRLWAYGPYAREIDLWAGIFEGVRIASPCLEGEPPRDCLAFEADNIAMVPQPLVGGETVLAKLRLVLTVPTMVAGLARAMFRADAIHVRCPGNLGLLGAILAPIFSRRIVAKYAAQWYGAVDEPLSYRLQRRILGSRWWRGPVTVYGQWPGQRSHVVPFFTASLTAEQLERGARAGRAARPHAPLRVLFTGRLSQSKNVDVLLRAVAQVHAQGHRVTCSVVGEGPERSALESLAGRLGLGSLVEFAGGVDAGRVLGYLETADVLVLASETEGWPKSIAEAMAFGLVCVGSNRGLVPQMLGEGRGIVVPPRDVPALASVLANLSRSPNDYLEMRRKATAWARQFSIEGLRDALLQLLNERWGVALQPSTGRRLVA